MELTCCGEAKVTIRSKSPTKPRRLRRVGSEQRRKLLGLTPRPEQTQHSKKGEENTREEKSSQKAQLLQKGGEGGGTEGGLEKKRKEKENCYLRQEKKGEKKLKRKREEENGGEERERELKRKRVEEYESQPLEGEKEGEEEEPRREKEEKANETETPETSEEGGEEELKVKRTTEEEKNQSQTPGKKEGEVELMREEKKDNQAHLLEKTEEAEEEGERELRGILASRQRSGCSCKGRCREEICECLQAGIHCRHTGFLGGRSGCTCTSRGCNNVNTRRTGWRQSRQDCYMQAMARFSPEKCFRDEDEGEGASSSPGRAEEDESANCDYRQLILDDEEDYEDILSFRLSSLSIDSEEEKNRAHTRNTDCSSDLKRSHAEEGASSSPGRGEEDENCDYKPLILDDDEDYENILSDWRPFDNKEGEEQSS